jgi:hypothetical protein
MQSVNLVSPLGRLVQQLLDRGEFGGDPVAQAALWDIQQTAAQIAHDPTNVALQVL